MTVEITDEQAREILYGARFPFGAEDGSPLAEALSALHRGLAESRKSRQRGLVGDFLEGWQRGVERAHRDERPHPRWEWVAKAISVIDKSVRESEPMNVARLDRLGATIRDTFDALGLSLGNEETLYVVLVTLGEMVELGSNAVQRGQLDRETLEKIAAITQAFTAALLPYMPAEALGR